MANTAWGEQVVSFGTPAAGDTMSASLTDIGKIKEDTVSIEKADGTVLELFSTGHNLVDKLKGEPTLTLKFTLIGITAAAIALFWDATLVSTRTTVKSLVNSDKLSVKLASKVVGADTLEAPYCEVSMGPLFAEKEGWTAEISVTIIKGASGNLFFMDKVAA
jgi:hypothetical protein